MVSVSVVRAYDHLMMTYKRCEINGCVATTSSTGRWLEGANVWGGEVELGAQSSKKDHACL